MGWTTSASASSPSRPRRCPRYCSSPVLSPLAGDSPRDDRGAVRGRASGATERSRANGAAHPMSEIDEHWTSVWTAPTLQEAHLAVARLRSQGLSARVDGENMSPFGGALGPSPLLHARVQVLRPDAD